VTEIEQLAMELHSRNNVGHQHQPKPPPTSNISNTVNATHPASLATITLL